MLIATPDTLDHLIVNLCNYDYLNVEPYDRHMMCLKAYSNAGDEVVLKKSTNVQYLRGLQIRLENSERSSRFAPTTVTLQ